MCPGCTWASTHFQLDSRSSRCISAHANTKRSCFLGKQPLIKSPSNEYLAQWPLYLTSYKDYENMEYAQVVRTRLEVIDKLESMLKANELENATPRDFVSDNPWLLDPAWERATRNAEKEKAFRTIGEEEYKLDFSSDSESNSRVDIKYLTAPDRETIVEFKRYGRDIKIEEIREQVWRYAEAMTRILEKDDARTDRAEGRKNASGIDERVNVLIIVRRVLDNRGKPMSPGAANAQVEMFWAKFLYFSDMLAQSRERYQEFVKGVSQKDDAGEAIQAIEFSGSDGNAENI